MGSADQKGDITWHLDVLSQGAQRALLFFREQEWLRKTQWYLAGGTAFALHTGHRSSVDLDFFTPRRTFEADRLLDKLPVASWVTHIAKEGTIYGTLGGTKVSFIAYQFFAPKEKPHWYGAMRILDPRDIAVMKIVAVSQRGRKRDFVDLYWYVTHREPLANVIGRVSEQYPTVAHDFHHILKALMYFDDADRDPMPKIFFNASWKNIRQYFEREVPKIAKEILLR